MWAKRITLLVILTVAALLALFIYKSEPRLNPDFSEAGNFIQKHSFRLGLDLSGGSRLVYEADVSAVPPGEVRDSMDALRDVIERRVNLFGVSEPIVAVQRGGLVAGAERLMIDLPGVTDLDAAVEMIGQTPLLEFKVENPNPPEFQTVTVNEDGVAEVDFDPDSMFIATELTGRYLKRAVLQFDPNTREPIVSLEFDSTGTRLFAEITAENIGRMVAIYLDGMAITTPVARESIPSGEAVITGSMTAIEARTLVGRLNSGALPVPITLVSEQTIGATLGERAVSAGVMAAIVGFVLIAAYLLLWYRLPGLVSVLSLSLFVIFTLALYKLIPVTLTAAGIAGFVVSIGMAVDANVLTFERIKEEMRAGKKIREAVEAGFTRAWTSIRDSNTSSLITGVILFAFGTTLIKGFALTFVLGILVSLFTELMVTHLSLSVLATIRENKFTRFLFHSGFGKSPAK